MLGASPRNVEEMAATGRLPGAGARVFTVIEIGVFAGYDADGRSSRAGEGGDCPCDNVLRQNPGLTATSRIVRIDDRGDDAALHDAGTARRFQNE